MLTDFELMDMQVEALFTHDPDGRIRYTNEPGETPAPRFFLGRTKDGNIWRFRYDLPDSVVRELDALASSEPVTADLRAKPANFEAFREILQAQADVKEVYWGPAYCFPDELPTPANTTTITRSNLHALRRMVPDLEDVAREFEAGQPTLAVIEAGVAVSVCFSSRLTGRAAEAGVETLEEFRGRGYAAAVVAGWAQAVRAMGRIPLYSTSWDNLASQGVARRLGLVLYGVDLSFA